jgi:catechol 2,3-dioxygenase-like lactoylglutathione lyase family enzyme
MEIGQIAVTVSDVTKALPFYRDVMGLKFLFSPSPNLAFLGCRTNTHHAVYATRRGQRWWQLHSLF